jgi:hypothetical protein
MRAVLPIVLAACSALGAFSTLAALLTLGSPALAANLCPDGSYVSGPCHLAPDGSWVGGKPALAPDGSWVGNPPEQRQQPIQSGPRLAPDGSYIGGGGRMTRCSDGSYVAGSCRLAPDGSFVGD